MPNNREVKVRFLAHGIVTIPDDQLPKNFSTMTQAEVWEWVNGWWDERVDLPMLHQGLINCDAPEECCPGLVEVFPAGGIEYETLAQSNEYHEWWVGENSTALFTGGANG
jgi:hypothetical protein